MFLIDLIHFDEIKMESGGKMYIFIFVLVLLSLWSITKTLEKLKDKILAKQERQIEVLEQIQIMLEEHKEK